MKGFHYGSGVSNRELKRQLFVEGRQRQCERCGLKEWLGRPIPLELDHIDSDATNNELDNLQILCPNCHSQKTKDTRRDSALERQIGSYGYPLMDDDYGADYELDELG